MNITIKHIGSYGGRAATCIELTIEGSSWSITEDITDLKGRVDDEFIKSLRMIVDELEEQNKQLK